MAELVSDLVALRDLLWESLQDAEPDRRASLAKEYRSVIERLEVLTGKGKAGDPIDEIAARRAARGAVAASGSG